MQTSLIMFRIKLPARHTMCWYLYLSNWGNLHVQLYYAWINSTPQVDSWGARFDKKIHPQHVIRLSVSKFPVVTKKEELCAEVSRSKVLVASRYKDNVSCCDTYKCVKKSITYLTFLIRFSDMSIVTLSLYTNRDLQRVLIIKTFPITVKCQLRMC